METSMADIASVMSANKDNFLEGNGIVILILFLLFLSGGGSLFGNNNTTASYVTQSDIQRSADFSNISNKLDNITSGISTSNYDTAQMINNSNMQMINGFNNVSTTMNNGFNMVNANITQLSNQLHDCCCELKSQILQDKYDSVSSQLAQAQGVVANNVQTQNILNALGRYYAYPSVNPYVVLGTGTTTGTTTTT